jgi:hypothetical protein
LRADTPTGRCLPHWGVQPIVATPPITRISTLPHSGANLIVALPDLLASSNTRFPTPTWPAVLEVKLPLNRAAEAR